MGTTQDHFLPDVDPESEAVGPDQERVSAKSLSFGASILGAVVGVQMMMSLFVIVPPPASTTVAASAGLAPGQWFKPERDLEIYVSGCAATLLLIVALGWSLGKRLRRLDPARREVEARRASASLVLLALFSAMVFLPIMFAVTTLHGGDSAGAKRVVLPEWMINSNLLQILLVLPGAVGHALGLCRIRLRFADRLSELLEMGAGDGRINNASGSSRRVSGWLWALGITLGVFGLLMIPRASEAAGLSFTKEYLFPFLHWNAYVMGPALGYRDGRGLGVDVYTEYGVGYPLLVNWLSPLVPMSYPNFIQMAWIYGCLYFIASLAALLRVLLLSWPWAATGVFAAIYLQAFQGIFPGVTTWNYPSSSVLRYAMDVWFFWALLLHLRTARLLWAVSAGMIAAIGFLLHLDTGTYLVVVLVSYLLSRMILVPRGRMGPPLEFRRELISSIASITAAAVTILAGFALATRRSPLDFDRETFAALFETVKVHATGFSCSPLAYNPSFVAKCVFMLVVGTYLAYLGAMALALIATGIDRRQVFRCCLATYGLAAMLIFVQASIGYNIFHPIIPFVILAVDGVRAPLGRLRLPERRTGLTAVIVLAAVVLLLTNPNVRNYPGLIQSFWGRPTSPGTCLTKIGVCGLPLKSEVEEFALDFDQITTRMAGMRASGARVAFLDESEPMFLVASGVSSVDRRFCPLFYYLLTQYELEQAKARFSAAGFDVVVMRNRDRPSIYPVPSAMMARIWNEFRTIVERDFEVTERIGAFEVWFARGRKP